MPTQHDELRINIYEFDTTHTHRYFGTFYIGSVINFILLNSIAKSYNDNVSHKVTHDEEEEEENGGDGSYNAKHASREQNMGYVREGGAMMMGG